MRILVVEDDIDLGEAITQSLSHSGYAADHVISAKAAIHALTFEHFDAAVLDIGLPDGNGLEVVRQIRQYGKALPILILTARDVIDDRVLGLDLGADDYVIKPISMKELQARIRALIRRSVGMKAPQITLGKLELNLVGKTVYLNQKLVELSGREWEVLEFLATRPRRIISKEQLIQAISGWNNELSENAIEAYVHRVRSKLSDSNVIIRTVRGLGYMLEEIL